MPTLGAHKSYIRPNQSKAKKKFQKSLDKLHKVWYNKIIKGKENPTNQKGIDTMANTKKMTKREMFEQIKANYNLNADEIAFIDHELELLAKKNSAEKKPTAVQVANEGIKDAIVDAMEVGKKYTITDLMKSVPACADLSNQRVSALVRQLVNDEVLVRTEEKRKAYFHKVA